MRRWRSITFLSAAALLAVVLGHRLLRRPVAEPAAARPKAAPSVPKLVTTKAATPPAPAQDPGLADPGPGEHLAYYGGLSGRLSPSADPEPEARPFQVTSVGAAPTLIAWADRMLVQAGDEVTVTARLVDTTGVALLDAAVDVRLRAGEQRELVLPMQLVNDRWRATFASDDPRLGAAAPSRAPTDIDFVVRARRGDGDDAVVRTALGVVVVQRPGARLATDSARVQRRGEDIVLTVDAEVQKPGSYWVTGELWGGPDGRRPIAFGRRTLGKLGTGRHPAEVLFGGRIVRDVGVRGPYIIRNVRLVQTDTTPPHVAPTIAAITWPGSG